MSDDQHLLAPIMSNSEEVYQLGPNAYGKPATALNILRETVMGSDLFDHAFKTYSQRWMFKHPTPEDFFRSMEDASAVDLDWFWRGWFYTTDFVDIGVESVNTVQVTSEPPAAYLERLERFGYSIEDLPPLVFRVSEDDEDYDENAAPFAKLDASQFLEENGLTVAQENLAKANYLYEITFNKPGGLVMPILVEYTYSDGSTMSERYPVQIWRKNDNSYTRVLTSEKEIVGVQVDPNEETADVNTTNNSWPREEVMTDFDRFKENN